MVETKTTNRRPILERSDPVVVYLTPEGKMQLKVYAAQAGRGIRVHDLLLAAIEDWATNRGLPGPWRVLSEKPRRYDPVLPRIPKRPAKSKVAPKTAPKAVKATWPAKPRAAPEAVTETRSARAHGGGKPAGAPVLDPKTGEWLASGLRARILRYKAKKRLSSKP